MPICGIIEECLDIENSIFLFKPCFTKGHLIIKLENASSNKEHLILRSFKRFRIAKNQETLCTALKVSHFYSAPSCCKCMEGSLCDLPLINVLSDFKTPKIPFLTHLESFIYFKLKRFQLGLLKNSSPTNLFKIVPAFGCGPSFYLVCNNYRNEKSVLKESLVLVKKPPSNGESCYYALDNSELEILAENKNKPDFPPNIVIKEELNVKNLFGRLTGDYRIESWLISDILSKEGSVIWLGDVKGFASIRLYNLKTKYPIPAIPDVSNRFLRMRMYLREFLLKVDDRGQHFLLFLENKTQMHLEYWSMNENILAREQIPYEFLLNITPLSSPNATALPIYTNDHYRPLLVFKFHFMPLRKFPNGYFVIDKMGGSAIVEDTRVLILRQWHLGIGQVIRMNNPLRILLQKLLSYNADDPAQKKKEWSILQGIYEPFIAICRDDLKRIFL